MDQNHFHPLRLLYKGDKMSITGLYECWLCSEEKHCFSSSLGILIFSQGVVKCGLFVAAFWQQTQICVHKDLMIPVIQSFYKANELKWARTHNNLVIFLKFHIDQDNT